MLRSESLFGKRDTSTATPGNSFSTSTSTLGQTGPSGVAKTTATGSTTAAASSNSTTNQDMNSTNEVGSKLIVGPNIKLKGVEITDCDTLVVEGRVEATINSRAIQIAESGAFKGSAEVDIAEIHGEFDGEVTVRQKLVIHATGKVSGKVRYGKLVVEEGGQMSGDIQVGTSSANNTRGLSVAKVAQ